MMSRTLTDITILMIVGSVPDYVQGFVKLYWLVSGKTRKETMISLQEFKHEHSTNRISTD
jgi:hypothetical protein